jgi:hypothetical protein
MTDQSIEDASRNSIIEDAKAAGFYIDYSDHEGTSIWDSNPSDVEQDGCGMVELNKMLTKFAQLREARQSSQSEPVAVFRNTDDRYFVEFPSYDGLENIPDKSPLVLAAPQQAIPSGWTDIKDSPPDDGIYVIAAIIIDGKVWNWNKARYSSTAKCWMSGNDFSKDFTHWMPLSASPTAPIESDK